MARKRSSAKAYAAGPNGPVEVQDLRFDPGAWPISFEIAAEHADKWTTRFEAECQLRHWAWSGQTQIDAEENSGTIVVEIGAPTQARQLEIVWARPRDGPLAVQARTSSGPASHLEDVERFFATIRTNLETPPTSRVHRRGFLYYEGMAWRGELWLDDHLRLGPPRQQYEDAIFGPRVIVVDAMVPAYSPLDAGGAFRVLLSELASFLSVVLETLVRSGAGGHVWVTEVDAGITRCRAVPLGYWEGREAGASPEMPTRDAVRGVPMRAVNRPDGTLRVVDSEQREQWAPADTACLWAAFSALPGAARNQFTAIARTWQLVLTSHAESHRTAGAALLVVACEAMKPIGQPATKKRQRVSFGDVLGALLGTDGSRLFDGFRHHPQGVRDSHLHNARLFGGELERFAALATSLDPSFDQMVRLLATAVPAAAIEWLKCSGKYALPIRKHSKSAAQPEV